MADAGLDADVTLDIRAALRSIDRLEEALSRAVTGVVVTADARAVTAAVDAAIRNADSAVEIVGEAEQLTGEITAAVDAADTAVIVTGDASELTGDVTAAVDAGDSQVIVTGDASELTGDVTAAVDAGDSNVSITADTTQAQAEVMALGRQADVAAGNASRLKAALAGIGALGVAKALFEAASAASDLAESTSKATAVFGPATGEIQTFALGAAQALGLSEQAALEAAGTFGNLFQALGASQEVAADLSPKILTLAADLASFNNIGIDEALEKLRSGLVGEIEPLRGLGISFTAAEVEARAFEDGLVDANGVVTEGAKLQARYSLIMEQSAIASGDFARTSGGLANQQRILTAEFQNAVAAAGQALLPALLELVQLARDDLIPQLGELAEGVLPAFADILIAIAPLLGTTLDLLILMTPVIEAIGAVVSAIPEPLLAAAGSALIFSKAFGGLGTLLNGSIGALKLLPSLISGTAEALPRATSGVGPLAGGITRLGTALANINPLMVGATVAVIGLVREWQASQQAARAHSEGVEQVGESLAQVGTEYHTAQGALEAYTTALVKGEQETEIFGNALDNIPVGELFTELGLSAKSAAELLAAGPDAVDEYVASLGDLDQESGVAAAALRELTSRSEEAVQQQLAALKATDGLTAAQERQLDALDRTNAPAAEYVALLDDVTAAQEIAAHEAELATAKYGPLADQFVETGAALDRLSDSAPEVASQIAALRTGTAGTSRDFVDLALSIGEAALTEEQMADAAALLGTDVATLTGIVDTAKEALDDFVSEATSNLPSIADAFANVGDDSLLSVQEFIDGLTLAKTQMANFRDDLAVLAFAGFSDIAAIIAEQGPEVGGALASTLAQALKDGNVEVLEEVRAATTGFNTEWENTATFFREVIGPEMILQSGLLGEGITSAFGSNLTFAERIRIAAALAKSGLTTEGQAIAAIAAVEGAQAARDYGTALNLDDKTIEEAIRAGNKLKAHPTTASREAGLAQGGAYGKGFGDGITGYAQYVNDKAAQLGYSAKAAMDTALNSQSPSKELYKRGIWFGEGLALGIEDTTAMVVAEAEALGKAAVDAVEAQRIVPLLAAVGDSGTVRVEVDPAALATASVELGTAGSSTGATIGEVNIELVVPVGMTREQAAEVGEGLVDGMERRLSERTLVVLGRST